MPRMTLAGALAVAAALAGPLAAPSAAVPVPAAPVAWTSLHPATPARSAATVVQIRREKLSAHFVLATQNYTEPCSNCGPGGTPLDLQRCSWAIFLEFPVVPGATSYRAVVQDTNPRVNTTYDLTGPPFSDDKDGYKAPPGTHRFGGFTGGSGPAPCYSLSDFKGRFILKKAFVTTKQYCDVAGARGAAGRVLIGACPEPLEKEKTQDQKDAATEQKRIWEDRYIFWGGLAAVFTGATAYAGSNPVTAPAAGPLGFLAAGNGLLAWWASAEATYWGRVAEDPPDRNWRRIARPAATHPGRIALPRTLSKRTRTAARALIANQLRSGALDRCIAQAIDRGTTALPKSPRTAARQYAAGAKCAREKARRIAATPRLVAPLVRFLRPYDARILAATAAAPRGAAFRRLIARNIAALGKAAGLTRAERKALARRILTAPAPSPAVAPSAALALAGAQAAKQAAETRQVARALAAAAAGR